MFVFILYNAGLIFFINHLNFFLTKRKLIEYEKIVKLKTIYENVAFFVRVCDSH